MDSWFLLLHEYCFLIICNIIIVGVTVHLGKLCVRGSHSKKKVGHFITCGWCWGGIMCLEDKTFKMSCNEIKHCTSLLFLQWGDRDETYDIQVQELK